jgi:hypothetical protein
VARSSHRRYILSVFGSDAKETKVIVQQIASEMNSRDCSYHNPTVITCTSSQLISGERILHDLQGWLTPPDPSTNHNIACNSQHERTAAWVFSEIIYKEWESSGSLLWIHGKGLSLHRVVYMSSDDTTRSWIWKKHTLVCLAIVSPYVEAYSLDQLCYHPAYHHSAQCGVSFRRLFLF